MNKFKIILTSLCLAGGSLIAAETNVARPNIVFCFADDWGRYASIYTNVETRPSINQVISTPNIDRMAREGVLFKNAFVTAPSCTPCRSSLLSGQYFFRTGRGAILQTTLTVVGLADVGIHNFWYSSLSRTWVQTV